MLLLVIALASTSCFSRAANRRFEQRTQEIDRDYETGLAGIEYAYIVEHRRIKQLEQSLVAVDTKNTTQPISSVMDKPELTAILDECGRLSKAIDELKGIGANVEQESATLKQCAERWNGLRVQLMVTTYWAADLDWIVKTLAIDPAKMQMETLFVYSHNLRLRAYIQQQLAKLEASWKRAKYELAEARSQAVQQARIERDAEIAERRQRFALAMSVVAQAMANSRTPARQTTHSPSTSSRGCSSDFQCGVGARCVKANYSATGFCATAVNRYGVQTFEMPDMESVLIKMPKGSDCHFDTECPVGFRCDVSSGACLR